MKLYFSPGACSQAPHILVHELGLNVDTEKVNLRNKGDYLKINPKGYVPALVLDDESLLTEVAVVLQYLADLKPEAGMIPKSASMERYRCLEWLNYVATEIHKGISPLWRPSTPDAYKEILVQDLARKFTFLDEHFSKSAYLMGSQMTVADIYLFVVASWTRYLKIDISSHKNVLRFLEQMAARPSVKATLAAEGINK